MRKTDKRIFCVGVDAPAVIEYLESRGDVVLVVERDSVLPGPLRSHADLQVFPLAGGTVLVNSRQKRLTEALSAEGFVVLPVGDIGSSYPEDCRLNGFLLNNRIVGNRKCLSGALLERYDLFDVRQGYAKCSSIVLNGDTVFTDDISIFSRLSSEEGIDCRCFPQEEIVLKGYDKGFLGGCCGLISSNEILFSGDPAKLSSGQELIEALKDKGVAPVCLSDEAPYDFGGIVTLN